MPDDQRTEAQQFADRILNLVPQDQQPQPAQNDPTPQQIAADVARIDQAYGDTQ